MNRRDVLTSLREGSAPHLRGGRSRGKAPTPHIELETADHEEPTWEVHRPGTPRRRFDRRARTILTAAAIAAVLANAGAAWAYWRFNGPSEPVGAAFELALSGTSDTHQQLRPGSAGNLTITVANRHAEPIRITSIMRSSDSAVADHAHRAAGCVNPQVEINQADFPVIWEVPEGTIGTFILPGALTMRSGPAACRGATFSVPVQAHAVRYVSGPADR
ncbi:hypothetical protein [Actinoplanes aureus]|uniref:Uncharacterized protein n=1 Tax=Actinoplanes aureus TaxID=2792083 RepID=A0A931C643_9ACTN|nr:hypothetical protein [Actinoplanes aureus]MBG0561726.1 hypothetical protein [Actinoplanes aureus]